MKINHLISIVFFLLMTGCNPLEEPEPQSEGRILVLMYHRIVNGEPGNLYERSIEDLEADLKYITDNKIKVISFSEMGSILSSGKMPTGNCVILTFDDGDHSWLTLVRNSLIKNKMKATFFLWTNMIGHDSFLSWNEVEEMSYYTLPGGIHPFIFGSHTFSHQYLLQKRSQFSTDAEYQSFLDYELGVSKEMIEAHTPEKVSILSLPYGDGAGDQEIISAAERNGYKYIRTSVWSAVDNPDISLFAIPALPMLDSTKPEIIGSYLGL